MIEILVAVLIFSIGISGLMALNNTLIRTNNNLKQYVQAINLANSQIEKLRSYTTLAAYNALAGGTTTITSDNTTFTQTTTVTATSSPAYSLVEVKVTWADVSGHSGSNQTVDLTSIIAGTDPIAAGQTIV